jgi:putative ABC transport system permease protein
MRAVIIAACDGLKSHGMRTILSGLGIMIGVTTMIVLGDVLAMIGASMTQGLRALGGEVLVIGPSAQMLAPRLPQPVSMEDVGALERSGAFESVAPLMTVQGLVVNEPFKQVVGIYGLTPDQFAMLGMSVRAGRSISDLDGLRRLPVAIVGTHVGTRLHIDRPNVPIIVSGRSFTVVGIAAPSGQVLGVDRDESVFIPLPIAEQLYGSAKFSGLNIFVHVKAGAGLATSIDSVERILRRRRQIEDDEQSDFVVHSQRDLLGQLQSASTAVEIAIIVVVGISFAVAAIGVLNSILTSVIERYGEIGLRRAVGATSRSITGQFVMEGMAIGLGGSVCGAILAVVFNRPIAALLALRPVMNWRVVMFAMVAANALVAGAAAFPARFAGRIAPIDAIRHGE